VTPVSTRLVRLLNMVPYFQANPRITRAEAAADLGVSAKQLEDDLNQLWLCGLPGYGPGDLIDFQFSGDTIEVTFSAGMDRPLQLTSPEATGLLMALRALADIPGVVDPEAARSAIAKIESAAGAVGHSYARHAAVDEPAAAESDAAAAVRAAVRGNRALAIDYYSASRDTLSTRTVDPIRVVVVGEHSYLEACKKPLRPRSTPTKLRRGQIRRRRRCGSIVRTSGGIHSERSHSGSLGHRRGRVDRFVRRQEAPRRGTFAGQVVTNLQV
jgi:proteasome accessory factor C